LAAARGSHEFASAAVAARIERGVCVRSSFPKRAQDGKVERASGGDCKAIWFCWQSIDDIAPLLPVESTFRRPLVVTAFGHRRSFAFRTVDVLVAANAAQHFGEARFRDERIRKKVQPEIHHVQKALVGLVIACLRRDDVELCERLLFVANREVGESPSAGTDVGMLCEFLELVEQAARVLDASDT
jgi:hypothetical protein